MFQRAGDEIPERPLSLGPVVLVDVNPSMSRWSLDRRIEVGGVTRTSNELQRDVAILIKQSDDLKVFARELAKAVDKLRANAEELKAAIGKSTHRKAR